MGTTGTVVDQQDQNTLGSNLAVVKGGSVDGDEVADE
jgi:hypothetical protein